MINKAVFNWSGGKDSAIALAQVLREKSHTVVQLLTSVNKQYQRISMHGVRVELLKQQAKRLGLPVHIIEVPETPTMEAYNQAMRKVLLECKKMDIHYSIFGDIFLDDLRAYREQQLAQLQMKAIFPIWKYPTNQLVRDFISQGFKAITVCVSDQHLDKTFVGREINEEFLRDLPSQVDPCGENGEFHSFVYDGPIFDEPIFFKKGELVYRKYQAPAKEDAADDCCGSHDDTVFKQGFWYCDLLTV